jgi:DNA-binding response OmpR family regulator
LNTNNRVLIIDDDEDVIVMLRHYLSDAGYEVIHALDGIEGLALAIHESPDIVVSDILMPEFDGFGVLAALRANAPTCTLPIVFLTVLDDTESKARAMRLGVDAYLNKPVLRESLLEAVAGGLRRSKSRRSEAAAFGFDLPGDMAARDTMLMRDFASLLPARRSQGMEPKSRS